MFVHRSGSLEELVDHLHLVTSAPGLGLLEPETIVIQSAGMERYLSRELARRSDVAANLQFPYPRAFFHRILDAALGQDDRAASFERESLIWVLYANLAPYASELAPHFEQIYDHLQGDDDGSRRLLLAERLAHLFDQYVTYRPRMVLGWQEGHDPESSQAILWRALCEQLGEAHFAARCNRFMNDLPDQRLREALPSRVSLMGGPGLPPLYLQMFARLGQIVPCHLFSFSVCREYFADAHPLGESLPDVGQGLFPLLESMGKVGADYQHLLEMIGEYEEGAAQFAPVEAKTILAALQRSLIEGRADTHVVQSCARINLDEDDSITLDSCHSPLREVEVLHDKLLGWFRDDPSLRPEDVVVLAPQIEEYSPLISAVFAARSAARPHIPFRIADRSEKFTNSAAQALLLSLSVLRGRLKASEVLDLLQLAPVRSRYGIASSDLERIARWVSDSGIRWGADGPHKGEFGVPPSEQNSWRFGLRRLLLGFALPDDGEQLHEGVVPLDQVAVGDLDLIGRLCDFCDNLFSLRARLAQASQRGLSPSGWELFLGDLIDALLGESDQSGDVADQRWDTGAIRLVVHEFIERATSSLSLSGRDREEQRLSARALEHLLKNELDTRRPSTDFLSGGVTFCALLPLRTIPFRVVCVLGLNQGDFPRSDPHLQLDLMAASPNRGDRSLRADDRYLFLEVILAARGRLCLSYVGRSVQDNTAKPPSVVVAELNRVIETTLLQRSEDQGLRAYLTPTEHPLQPFHPDYFRPASVVRGRRQLRSFDARMFEGARALCGERKPVPAFFDGLEAGPMPEEIELTVEQLVRFWKDPSRAFLEARGVRLSSDFEQVEDREPVVETGLDRYVVGDRLLSRKFRGQPLREDVELSRGELPVGAGGRALLAHVDQAAEEIFLASEELRAAPRLDAPAVLLRFDSCPVDPTWGEQALSQVPPIVLNGVVDGLFGRVRLEISYGQLNMNRQLGLWIRHLAACAAGLDLTHSTLVVRGPPGSPQGVQMLSFAVLEPPEAKRLLGTLCALCVCGLKGPLRFFPEVSRKYFESLAKPPKKVADEKVVPWAIEQARRALASNQPDSPIAELYRGTDPLGLLDAESAVAEDDWAESPFARLAELVLAPMARAAGQEGES